jgi:hypothetical protein
MQVNTERDVKARADSGGRLRRQTPATDSGDKARQRVMWLLTRVQSGARMARTSNSGRYFIHVSICFTSLLPS